MHVFFEFLHHHLYKKRRIRMEIRQQIKQLYQLYSFELLADQKEYMVFTRPEGYFCNAEILWLKHSGNVDAIRQDYEKTGYSVKVTYFSSLEETHIGLFKGFFSQRNIAARLLNEYNEYRNKQENRLGGRQYRFIPCRFIGNENGIGTDVISNIYHQLFEPGPQLIIVEAAAGYGKTSISYELIRKLGECPNETAPLMTELSKNRRANIFKYVLLSEINAKFLGLSAELVDYEIREGRVPLIIDGFDELLSKKVPTNESPAVEDTEAAKTMFSTIAQLLSCGSQAKIVLTSRKSSIFAGKLFEDWSDKWLPNCEITRIQVFPPNVEDWLSADQLAILREKQIRLDDISNPTLLNFLSSKQPDDIRKQINSIEDILDEYFRILLEREKERQALPLTVDEQRSIMQNVALYMVAWDESSFSFDDIKALLGLIIEDSLVTYLSRYETIVDISEVPSEDEYLAKLSHHALLDRIPNTANLIGFINDFIFGFMIAEGIMRSNQDIVTIADIKEKYWELMITSYSVCCEKNRYALYEVMERSGLKFSSTMQLNADVLLLHQLRHKFEGHYFESFHFSSDLIIHPDRFSNCSFSYCVFKGCKIYSDAFDNCQFFGCQFYNVEIVSSPVKNCHLIFSNCTGEQLLSTSANREPVVVAVDAELLFEKKVLEQYWRPGSDHADRRRLYDTLFRGNNQQDYSVISEAIDRLLNRGILIPKNNCIELNFAMMAEIKQILGR